MAGKLTYKDLGLGQFLRRSAEANTKVLRVGVVGQKAEDKAPDGTPYGLVALYNEFGTKDGHVPERSFVRSTMRDRALTGVAAVRVGVAYFRLGMDLGAALAYAAAPIVDAMKAKVRAGGEPFTPNAASTIRQKGSTQPLIDSGGLEQHVGYIVVRNSGDTVEAGQETEFEAYEVGGEGNGGGVG